MMTSRVILVQKPIEYIRYPDFEMKKDERGGGNGGGRRDGWKENDESPHHMAMIQWCTTPPTPSTMKTSSASRKQGWCNRGSNNDNKDDPNRDGMILPAIQSVAPTTTAAAATVTRNYSNDDADKPREEEFLEQQQQQSASSMHAQQRRVTFNRNVKLRRSLHLNNFTDEEYENTWYTPSEMARIKTDVKFTIELADDGLLPLDVDDYTPVLSTAMKNATMTMRGLECRTRHGMKQRSRNKSIVRKAILDEQLRQKLRRDQPNDLNTLPVAYLDVCQRTKAEAYQRGLDDERVASEIYQNDFKQRFMERQQQQQQQQQQSKSKFVRWLVADKRD